MTAERGDDYVRVEGDERLDIPDFMAASALPAEAIWRLAGAIFGSADGVVAAAPLSWELAESGSGGSTVTLSKMLLYGGNPGTAGVDNNSASYVPSGFVLAYDPAGEAQVSLPNTINFAAGQAAGQGTSVWWARGEVAADLGNRRKYNGPSSKEQNEALLTRYRQTVSFATVVGDTPYATPPSIPNKTWHRLFFVEFATDGGPATVHWASPMDYWLSPANADGYCIARLLDEGAFDHVFTDPTGGHGFHLTVARVIRWLASQLLRTRDSRANFVEQPGGGTVATEGTGVNFHAIDRGLIQLDEVLAVLEAGAASEEGAPPLIWVGKFNASTGTTSEEVWKSPLISDWDPVVTRSGGDGAYIYTLSGVSPYQWIDLDVSPFGSVSYVVKRSSDLVYGFSRGSDPDGELYGTKHMIRVYGQLGAAG